MKKRFTFVELIIVVAMIGVLSSMLLPALESSRLKTANAVCTSNLSQIYKGMFSYLTKNNSKLPYRDGNKDVSNRWPSAIDPFIGGRCGISRLD